MLKRSLTIQQPTDSINDSIVSLEQLTWNPGIDSNLSKVPPVKPFLNNWKINWQKYYGII